MPITGIGLSNLHEVYAIASEPSKVNTFLVNTFDELLGLTPGLVAALCEGKNDQNRALSFGRRQNALAVSLIFSSLLQPTYIYIYNEFYASLCHQLFGDHIDVLFQCPTRNGLRSFQTKKVCKGHNKKPTFSAPYLYD